MTLARAPSAARGVVSGEEILMLDSLRSGPSSGMQILLLDETVFTIGPQSALVVDEFVYDPATSAGKVGATVAKGVFRFVTGKIAKHNPNDMNVALPAGNIGIRGTIVAGRVDDAARASLVILLGDSGNGTPGSGSASIEVCNAGACERVTSPGFGVKIAGPDAPPSPPFRVPTDEVEAILQAVSNPESALAGDVNGDAGQLGDATLPPEDQEREIRRKLQGLDTLDGLSDRAAQDGRIAPEPPPSAPQEPTVPAGGTGGKGGPGIVPYKP